MNFITKKNNKKYVVCDKNLLLTQVLNDNSHYNFRYYNNFSPQEIIDLLIINDLNDLDIANLFRVNYIINLSKASIISRELSICLPCSLNEILELVTKYSKDNNSFCTIADKWVYNQRTASLESSNDLINFTCKENDLFAAILHSKDLGISKNNLRKNVWHHSDEVESTTLETHIYKLRCKLPKDLLSNKGLNYYIKYSPSVL